MLVSLRWGISQWNPVDIPVLLMVQSCKLGVALYVLPTAKNSFWFLSPPNPLQRTCGTDQWTKLQTLDLRFYLVIWCPDFRSDYDLRRWQTLHTKNRSTEAFVLKLEKNGQLIADVARQLLKWLISLLQLIALRWNCSNISCKTF